MLMSKLLIALYIIATSSALLILKLGAKAGPPIDYANGGVHFNINAYTISGIALYGISFLLYTFLIAKYDLGYIIPLTTALVYVLIFAGSSVLFNESFTALKIIGIALVLGGVACLNIR